MVLMPIFDIVLTTPLLEAFRYFPIASPSPRDAPPPRAGRPKPLAPAAGTELGADREGLGEVLAALGPRPVLVTSTADPAELLHAALAYRSGK